MRFLTQFRTDALLAAVALCADLVVLVELGAAVAARYGDGHRRRAVRTRVRARAGELAEVAGRGERQ